MASNKNQHYVPKCHLKRFCLPGIEAAINLYNIDRDKVVCSAPIKRQCSGDYFYGDDPLLESAIRSIEDPYGLVINRIIGPGYTFNEEDKTYLKIFWLLQYQRTEAASKRVVEVSEEVGESVGMEAEEFRFAIKDAVQMAMRSFPELMHGMSDMKMVLIKNKADVPFITSDDPAILTNRWHFERSPTNGVLSFGLHSAGNLMLLPISPFVLCLGYDGDVYSIPHERGWVSVTRSADVSLLNQFQILNCRANLFFHDSGQSEYIRSEFMSFKNARLEKRHKINHAVLEREQDGSSYYKVVDSSTARDYAEAIVNFQDFHPRPERWPHLFGFRANGSVYTNDSGMGFVRKAWIPESRYKPFRKVKI